MSDLTITVIQPEVLWHDTAGNLTRIESLIKNCFTPTDLVILPEMFNTGFTMKPYDVSENMDGPSVKFLQRLSHEINADITGSIAIMENNHYFNRLVWMKPDGKLFTYDKRHLFRMGGENKVYSSGNLQLTVNLKGWNIRPFICYDLRFPVWTRNPMLDYDLAVFTANWPAARELHWHTLLRARAIENQCYVAGVNRTGYDHNNLSYNGGSSVIDFSGNIIFRADTSECIKTIELSYSDLLSYRESFPAWKDADNFRLSL